MARKLYIKRVAATRYDPAVFVSSHVLSELDKLHGTPPFTAPGVSPTPGAYNHLSTHEAGRVVLCSGWWNTVTISERSKIFSQTWKRPSVSQGWSCSVPGGIIRQPANMNGIVWQHKSISKSKRPSPPCSANWIIIRSWCSSCRMSRLHVLRAAWDR